MQYPASYQDARLHFREAALQIGAQVVDYVHPAARGPNGELISVDVAILGEPRAANILLSISGTHGPEGSAGSAAQTAFLENKPELAAGVGVVLVHALNPFGCAWGIIPTENDVDVSRNFVDFKSPPFNKYYDRAHVALAKREWPDAEPDRVQIALRELVEQVGPRNALTAITGGQYHRPDGLNYGGTEPTWSRCTLEQICGKHMSSVRRVAYVDFHTGFGSFGEPFFVCFHAEGSSARSRAAAWWGPLNENADAFGGKDTPDWQGLVWQGLVGWILPHAEICGAVVEFGTYPLEQVGEAVLIDWWLRHGDLSDPRRDGLYERLQQSFNPPSEVWRARVTRSGLGIQNQALRGLVAWASE